MKRILIAFVMLALSGCNVPSLLITPVFNSNRLEEIEAKPGQGFHSDKIALVEVEGMLINAKIGGVLQAEENKLSLFAQQMDQAVRDKAVKAVVLRINSPGGTVTCSDTMYEIVKDFRAKTGKPVIANTQEVCASGAYYLACGTDKIVVHPTSVVGSIGVIFESFEFSGTMSKIGVTSNSIKSGDLKDMGSPFKPLDPKAREVMQGMVNEYYARFVSVVGDNRHISDTDRLKSCTDGRVFTGTKAVELGLADRTGTLDDAIEEAKEMSKSPGARVIQYKRPYGYAGSIYATNQTPAPQANVLRLELPEAANILPRGFYYLWRD